MKIFYASLRPLEQKFVEYALSLQAGPEKAVLVLCPSERVASYLQGLLLKQQPIISNITFKTFGQLMAELDKQSGGAAQPLLPAEHLQDYLLKNLLLRPGLNRYPPRSGIVSALRSSLRDLADGMVEPEVLHEHWLSLPEFALEDEQAHLKWLIDVYRAYLQEMDQMPAYRSYVQYFSQVLTAAEDAPYLHGFKEILVYGFYELTGRQLELFHTLRTHYPMTVFWVYALHPAFAFGKKFFESNLLGLGEKAEGLSEDGQTLAANQVAPCLFTGQEATQPVEGVKIVSAADVEGELFFVAKEMVRLHEEQGIAYQDMAITARNLEPYKNLLPAVLQENQIAFRASFSHSVSTCPLGIFLHNLLNLARSGFGREEVLAVVQSPYFKEKKKSWRYLVEKCQAQRDFAQWVDLLRPSLDYYDESFMKWLQETKSALEELEQKQPWDVLCQAVEKFLEKNLDFTSFSAQEQGVWKEWEQGLRALLRFELVSKEAGRNEFLDEVMLMFKKLHLHQVQEQTNGVTVADVMNLRGLCFKVLFVLAMNEKTFPQVFREDPILKDYYRRILRDQLGYWINQKMERFDEERLLFFCTVTAASQHLYLSYLHSDAEGKPLVVSGYLAEVARIMRLSLQGEDISFISGRKTERLKAADPKWLTAKEVSLLLAGQGGSQEQYEQAGLLDPQTQRTWQACKEVASWGKLNAYDGVIKSGKAIFDAQNKEGFSPSALRDLAFCPMKYFFSKGLGLREKEEVLTRSELASNLRGNLYHKILMDYYAGLYREGLTGELFDTALRERLKQSLYKHYDLKSYKYFGIYPLIWELILKDMEQKLADFVVKDAAALAGFVPQIFETWFEKTYAPTAELNLKIKGIVDRIDIDEKNKKFRILDYKSNLSSKKPLAECMFKQVILQPFLYLILTSGQPQTASLQADGAALLGISKGYARQELPQPDFEKVSAAAAEFFSFLTGLITAGCFFINPSEHCQHCSYQTICRKDSFRSLLRARHAGQFQALQEAKQ